MGSKVLWDEFESSFLLENLVKVEEGKLSENEAIERVSQTLRQRAINQGLEIDSKFRNTNGIRLQMESMKSCYFNEPNSFHVSKLFKRTVQLYKNDREQFYKILKNDDFYQNKNTIDGFFNWVKNKFPSKKAKKIKGSLMALNLLLMKKMKVPLSALEITTLDQVLELKRIISSPNGLYIPSKKQRRQYLQIIYLMEEYYKQLEHSDYTNEDFGIAENNPSQSVSTDTDRINDLNEPDTDQIQKNIEYILNKYFAAGFFLNDKIELERFKAYSKEENLDIIEDNQLLNEYIKDSGIEFNDAIFYMPDKVYSDLNTSVDEILKNNKLIFYEILWDIHFEWMQSNNISSSELLKKVLQKIYPNFYFATNFFTTLGKKTEIEGILCEIQRVWGQENSREVSDLANDLSYIPEDKILFTLGSNDKYVRISKGKYFDTDFFILSEEQKNKLSEHIDEAISEKKYMFFSDIQIVDLENSYPELNSKNIYELIYKKYLNNLYHKQGNLLSLRTNLIHPEQLLREFCDEKEECTYDEVLDLSNQIQGRKDYQLSYKVLYDSMIRIEKDLYVADDELHFDVKNIDNILYEKIGDSYSAISEVVPLVLFPDCGYRWNHYVLESYCYRFSEKFKLMLLNFNDKNVGFIVNKNLEIKYQDILSEILADEVGKLELDDVGRYLFKFKYTLSKSYKWLPDVIKKAEKIREDQ